MADTRENVNEKSTAGPQPGIGHNRLSLAEAAEANVRSGVLLLCKEALITAIQDRRLHRDHLRVLAAIAMFVNTHTAKAWPSRAAVSAMSGLTVRGVSNALLQLRNWGYLIADRETVEEANNKRLTVYTFGNIDHEEIRRQITNIVLEMRKQRDARESEKSPPKVTNKSPPRVTVTPQGDEQVTPQGDFSSEKVTPGNARKSPPAVHSNSIKEQKTPSPIGDGAGASFLNLQELVWQHGIAYLRHAYGDAMPEVNLRTKLGVLVRDHGPGPVLDAIGKAQRQPGGVIDPLSYIGGILRGGPNKSSGQLPAWKRDREDKLARMRAVNKRSS